MDSRFFTVQSFSIVRQYLTDKFWIVYLQLQFSCSEQETSSSPTASSPMANGRPQALALQKADLLAPIWEIKDLKHPYGKQETSSTSIANRKSQALPQQIRDLKHLIQQIGYFRISHSKQVTSGTLLMQKGVLKNSPIAKRRPQELSYGKQETSRSYKANGRHQALLWQIEDLKLSNWHILDLKFSHSKQETSISATGKSGNLKLSYDKQETLSSPIQIGDLKLKYAPRQLID